MNFFLSTLTLIVLTAGFAHGVPSCRREITEYTIKNLRCAERGIEVQSLAQKVSNDELTYDELAEKIERICAKAETSRCYSDISTPITGSCNEAESVQHFRNAFKTVLTFNEYMCQSNGTKYLEFVKNHGAECYYNDEKAKCYTEGKAETGISDDLSFNDENVCAIVEVDWSCLRMYDDCENKNVARFYRQILVALREKFGC